ncbi:MAG: hypothetical protein KatS3mg103_0617 [Phycisphaerales bacterium]|nr:MAG: hypothetical protein KatS3mg103_0617 [Phycisphaerales bacterium]
MAKRTDVQAWDRYLQTLYEQRKVFAGRNSAGWQQLISEANTAIGYFLSTADADQEQAPWHRLRRYRALANVNMLSSWANPTRNPPTRPCWTSSRPWPWTHPMTSRPSGCTSG